MGFVCIKGCLEISGQPFVRVSLLFFWSKTGHL